MDGTVLALNLDETVDRRHPCEDFLNCELKDARGSPL